MAGAHIPIPNAEIAEFCRRSGIRRLALLGSVLTDRFTDKSDVDVLVEFEPKERVGYFKLSAMEQQLSQLLGRKVDLRTPNELSRYFRDAVLKDAQVQFQLEDILAG